MHGLLAANVLRAPNFTLVNGTGYSIRGIYISAANRNNWGRDRLGDGVLDNSRSRKLTFSDNANCVQDLKVVFDHNGQSVTWEDLDLCEIDKLTLRYNRASNAVTAIKE